MCIQTKTKVRTTRMSPGRISVLLCSFKDEGDDEKADMQAIGLNFLQPLLIYTVKKNMADPFNMYLENINWSLRIVTFAILFYLLMLFYFTDPSVSFFHDAFLCRILNLNNVFDAYKRFVS